MSRLLLQFLNAPVIILAALWVVAIESSLFTFQPIRNLQPELVILLVLWFGLKRSFIEGGILTLIVGEIAEANSGAPQGVLILAYVSAFLAIRSLSRVLVFPDFARAGPLAFLLCVSQRIIVSGIMFLLGVQMIQWEQIVFYWIPGAAATSILSIPIYRWLARWDWITFKDERARQALEDELQLEGEGL